MAARSQSDPDTPGTVIVPTIVVPRSSQTRSSPVVEFRQNRSDWASTLKSPSTAGGGGGGAGGSHAPETQTQPAPGAGSWQPPGANVGDAGAAPGGNHAPPTHVPPPMAVNGSSETQPVSWASDPPLAVALITGTHWPLNEAIHSAVPVLLATEGITKLTAV